jgi:hypothetical protein
LSQLKRPGNVQTHHASPTHNSPWQTMMRLGWYRVDEVLKVRRFFEIEWKPRYFGDRSGAVSREAYEEMKRALAEARQDFLLFQHPDSWTANATLMYALRGLLSRLDSAHQLDNMSDHAVAEAVYREVESGNLAVAPGREELQRYIERGRSRSGASGSPVQNSSPARQISKHEQARLAVQHFQRVPQSAASMDTPFGGAQPFDYHPDLPDANAEELATSTNNPRFAAKMLGYDYKTFGTILHKFKDANGLGPADNSIFHDNGDVEFNGKIFEDSIHDYAP